MKNDNVKEIEILMGDEYEDPDGLWTVKEIQKDQVEVEMVGYGDKSKWGMKKWVGLDKVKQFKSEFSLERYVELRDRIGNNDN